MLIRYIRMKQCFSKHDGARPGHLVRSALKRRGAIRACLDEDKAGRTYWPSVEDKAGRKSLLADDVLASCVMKSCLGLG